MGGLQGCYSLSFLSAATLSNKAAIPSLCAALGLTCLFRLITWIFLALVGYKKFPKKCRWEIFSLCNKFSLLCPAMAAKGKGSRI